MKQIDFEKYFITKKPEKINYRVRFNSNFLHDISYLSSYIHDARFNRKDIIFKKKLLIINLERDCWELGIKKNNELYNVSSSLVLYPVISISWEINNVYLTEFVKEMERSYLWIDNFYISNNFWENDKELEVFLSNKHAGWRLKIRILNKNARIELLDKEIPT